MKSDSGANINRKHATLRFTEYETKELMTYLEILELVQRNYTVGGDWVYEKSKSQEIQIIQALIANYAELRDEFLRVIEEKEKNT